MAHMSYFVITTDPRRAARWEHILGTEKVPVLCRHARWQMVGGREVLAYDLALSRLSQGQRDRLACYAAKRVRRPYAELRAEIEAAVSWPVAARDCRVVEKSETVERPSLFMPIVFAPEYNRLSLAGWGCV